MTILKFRRGCCVVIVLLCFASLVLAQMETASLSGRVTDPQGAVVPHTVIEAIENDTNIKTTTETNDAGLYYLPSLHPGSYRLVVSKDGFRQIIQADVVLHVQDILTLNFGLQIGSVNETMTVTGGTPLVDTESASVSTVIDRNFVESLPLNGRSFNTLLQLTPGVVLAQQTSGSATGQFSIAGQRTSGNNFLVDGVSANFGVAPTAGATGSGAGTGQAFSAIGGTSSLVSVDALQEFRVETSSFAPEFGRSPGGQVILNTRAGTNQFHGGLYDYFRNTVLDANDWFANNVNNPRAPEHHNDFGGFLGGPIQPNKTFFFASYEGARLRQPSTAIVQVPSEYARSVAPSPLAPFLNAYPIPDDRTIISGVYTGQFAGSYSNPFTLDAGSIRIDHVFNDRLSMFGRYNEAPSAAAVRTNSLSELDTTEVNTRTLTIGFTMTVNPHLYNTLRGNYSTQRSSLLFQLDSFGGAAPPDPSTLAPAPLSPASTYVSFYTFDTGVYQSGPNAKNQTNQLNFVDDLSVTKGAHQVKIGVDYRIIFLNLEPFHAFLDYLVTSVPDFLATGQADVYGVAQNSSRYSIQSTSLYAQDTWRMGARLKLTYGLRWEFDPAPAARGGTTLAAWENVNDPTQLALAPSGTPLWATTYSNFAPRIGAAYTLTPSGNLVLRGGFGIFYDLNSGAIAALGTAFPNSEATYTTGASMPLSQPTTYLPVLSTQPPYGDTWGFSPDLKLPRSYQWNAALEKAFGGKQVATLTYVGQSGRDLLRQEGISQPNNNFTGDFLLTRNNARSNYNALQLQYRRPLADRLQVLLNYTWSHSSDNSSNDTILAVSSAVLSAAKDYASSDFDVRHSFSGAFRFDVPTLHGPRPVSLVARDWSIDSVVVARTGFPFNGQVVTATIAGVYPRPDLVPGTPIWLSGSQYPGRKALNPSAFTIPQSGQQGTEGRNDIPGFGLTQADLSLARKFPITEKINLQFRADAFNALNHPNFTNPPAYIGLGPAFLQSTQMLNHGLGGLNPLFQEGGPRSLQLLRLTT
jgi:hypothetical protein